MNGLPRANSRALMLAAPVAFFATTLASAHPIAEPALVCQAWHQRGIDLQAIDRYLAAREALRRCSLPACSPSQRALCAHAERVLEEQTPRLLLRVHDRQGDELPEARVFVDGHLAVVGTAVEVDPGVHLVRTEADEHIGQVQRIRMEVGERLVLPVLLRARSDVADKRLEVFGDRFQMLRDERWPMPEAAWTMAGIGIASLAGAIVLDAYAAEGMESMKSCAPDCDPAVVEAVERDIQLSRIAGGVSIVSLATAAWLAIAETPADAFAPRSSGAPRLKVIGGVAGFRVTLTTSFDEARFFQWKNPFGRPPERVPPPPLPTEVLCPWGCAPGRPPLEF